MFWRTSHLSFISPWVPDSVGPIVVVRSAEAPPTSGASDVCPSSSTGEFIWPVWASLSRVTGSAPGWSPACRTVRSRLSWTYGGKRGVRFRSASCPTAAPTGAGSSAAGWWWSGCRPVGETRNIEGKFTTAHFKSKRWTIKVMKQIMMNEKLFLFDNRYTSLSVNASSVH